MKYKEVEAVKYKNKEGVIKNMKRRLFVKGSMLALMGSSAILRTGALFASERPDAAFSAKSINDTYQSLFGITEVTSSSSIRIKAPDIAENGAVVPITVETELKDVESITILAENNANPLVAIAVFDKDAEGYLSTRIKLGKTGDITAIVKSAGNVSKVSKEVKVTIGGCGG